MPRKPKPFSYNDLSKNDLKMLEYPPTEKTWICPGIYKNPDKTPCKMTNTGSSCWICGTAKPEKPKILWPTYIGLCEKVGIEPGTRWKKISAKTGIVYDREKGKWVEKDLEEGGK